VRVARVDQPEEVGPAVAEAGRTAFAGPAAAAVLIAQRLVGVKSFDE
jgi:hypothetical protein